MKRLLAGILLFVLMLLTGCTTRLDWMRTMDQCQTDAFQETMNGLISALNGHDAAALKGLFAPNVQSSVTDESIMKLLSFTRGKKLRADWDGLTSCGEQRTKGKITGSVRQAFDLYVDDVPYDCLMEIIYRCDADGGEVGAHKIRLASDYVRCDTDYVWPTEKGLHVLTETGEDFVTRRVGGFPHVWMDMDRRVSEEAVYALLREGFTRQDVIAALGEPNAWDEYIFCTYQMESVDGEARFVTFYGGQAEAVFSVSVYNEKEWLYQFWQ